MNTLACSRVTTAIRIAILAITVAAVVPTRAHADTIGWGIPVAGNGSSVQVGLPVVSNQIQYFIPLEAATSGTYGVTDTNGAAPGGLAGTFADTGNGPGTLNMWLKFYPVAPLPLATADIQFKFWDLDLANVNDPIGFFETFQLFSGSGTALSSQFTMAPNTTTSSGYLDVNPTSVVEKVNWTLTRSAGDAGATNPIYLDFYGDALASRITSPFWAKLTFTVPQNSVPGTNTAEYLTAKLTTTSQTTPVPEPGSVMLLGMGLAAVFSVGRFRLRQS